MKTNNDGIIESDIELRGLYILSAPLLEEKHVVKFGMSECLQNRISSYVSYFKTPYYMACYKFDDNYTKREILVVETRILNITSQYQADEFTSEYRKIEFQQLHDIVCDYLNKNEIVYTIFIKPTWKCFNKNNAIIVKNNFIIKCSTCSRGFQRQGHLDNHLKKKNKCKPEINIPLQPIQILDNNLNLPIVIKNKLECNSCNISFTRKDALIRHINHYCPIAKQQNKQKQDIFDKLVEDKKTQDIFDKLVLANKEQQEIIDKLKLENELLSKIK